jgi:hypothetical protein
MGFASAAKIETRNYLNIGDPDTSRAAEKTNQNHTPFDVGRISILFLSLV